MPNKIKSYMVTDATDAAKMTAGAQKVVDMLLGKGAVVLKAPSPAWIAANKRANNTFDVELEMAGETLKIQCIGKVVAGKATASAMGVFNYGAEKKKQNGAAVQLALEECGLV